MIDEKSFNKIASIVLIAALVFLSFFILKPIIIPSIFGLILAFICYPVYKWLRTKIKNKNLAALIICIVLLLIVVIPVLLLISPIVRQMVKIYAFTQQGDISTSLRNIAPNLFSSLELSQDFFNAINSFVRKVTASFLSKFTSILLNSPKILLNIMLILFVFFFGLRDGEELLAYIQSLSPLSEESEKKIFKQFKDITHSVIFGEIVVGIVQGIATGLILFILGVPNVLVLTLIATFVGVLPIIGPWAVWVPVDIYLFIQGRTIAGFTLLLYGLIIISWIDIIIRPLIVNKKTKMNSAVILVSMLGGLFVFGILGLILGPLVISYLLLLLEHYRNKKVGNVLIKKE